MDKPKVTPKDFFLWAAAMVMLYSGVVAFVALVFDYINAAFPNPVTNYYYVESPSISYETAVLIVVTPVFLLLMRLIRKSIAADPSRQEIWVRRWAIFLTLFLAGIAMVADLVVLVHIYLQGELLTVGFLLKVLTVFGVAALGFMHFLADVWGYWEKEPQKARMVNWAVGLLVLVTIIAGFFIIGTPSQMRAVKQDAIRVQNLQDIQWQVVNFWQQKESLPATLEELRDPISNSYIPTDPQTGAEYEYTRNSPLDFTLCATFATEGDSTGYGGRVVTPVSVKGEPVMDSWSHGVGRVCFERSIDPERYPPFSKTQ